MSRNGKKISAPQSNERREQQIRAALEKVFRHFNSAAGPRDKDLRTYDFVFHMTDWQDDLLRLAQVYQEPQRHSQKEWNDAVFAFLCHALGHLMAAAKLNPSFCDPFKAAPSLKGLVTQARRSSRSSRKVA